MFLKVAVTAVLPPAVPVLPLPVAPAAPGR